MECAQIHDLTNHWIMGAPPHYRLNFVKQIVKEWVSGNWYMLDHREFLYVCTPTLATCTTIIDNFDNKPQAIAVDPAAG